jgi:lipid A 3-O-deacylase
MAQPGVRPRAADGAFAQFGLSERSRSLSLGIVWDLPWSDTWLNGATTAYAEVSLADWRSMAGRRLASGDPASFTLVGATPVVRWYPRADGKGWFAEGGIGINFLSPVYRVGGRRFSSSLNFGDHLGLGWRSGKAAEHEWVLRVQHFSNAGLRVPNPGEDFAQLRYLRRF